ncbi:MAG: thiamine diphosphokinase [Bacteroidetes bacterium]|jgi:thiamine pyrophosphokinase|nr:thiamine diphosphokinase [Bacteroidota bacterium]
MPSPLALILANGQAPTKSLLNRHLADADVFVCADGGANAAAKLGVVPDLIIGDLDSILPATVKKFSGVTARRIADQNSTDLEKALLWSQKNGYKHVRVLGATGGRLDHAVGNLSALVKFSRKLAVTFHDADGDVSVVGTERTFDVPVGTTVSLLPLTLCEGVMTRGLKWELRYESLALGHREGTSNVVVASPVTVKLRRGDLLFFVAAEPTAKSRRRHD